MTEHGDLAAWADRFAARHGLDRGAFFADPTEADLQLEGAMLVLKQIPARYSDALPDDPGVEAWLADLLRRALADSAGHPAPAVRSGESLLLLGATGTGKTYQAMGVVRAIAAFGVRSGWKGTTAPDLCALLRPRHGVDADAEFRRFADANLLTLDDLGAAKNSEWVEEMNYRLINRRYEAMLPAVFTSNVPPKELADVLGDRVASRLTEMTTRVVLGGVDRRRAA